MMGKENINSLILVHKSAASRKLYFLNLSSLSDSRHVFAFVLIIRLFWGYLRKLPLSCNTIKTSSAEWRPIVSH